MKKPNKLSVLNVLYNLSIYKLPNFIDTID